MAVALLVVVAIVAIVAVAFGLIRSKARSEASDLAGIGANEFLKAPPTSFPADALVAPDADPAVAVTPAATAPAIEPAVVTPEAAPASPSLADDDDEDDEEDDEVVIARFRSPGSRSRGIADSAGSMAPVPPAYHLEGPVPASDVASSDGADDETLVVAEVGPVVEPTPAPTPAPTPTPAPMPSATPVLRPAHAADETPAVAGVSPVVEPTPTPAPRPTHAADPEPEGAAAIAAIAAGSPAHPSDGPAEAVIDLVAADAEVARHAATPEQADDPADDAAGPWQEVVLAAEPDTVDHVLQALINRARFKQVGVEEVATELVERSDLHGDEVSDVLASLVGRADRDEARPASELTLFNDEVPSRPGQLTDFAKLKPADKKRIIVRVLCLLVARSEDQQLPPRVESGGPKNQWPLARAVWPVAPAGDEDGDAPLPSRRLAKSR